MYHKKLFVFISKDTIKVNLQFLYFLVSAIIVMYVYKVKEIYKILCLKFISLNDYRIIH